MSKACCWWHGDGMWTKDGATTQHYHLAAIFK